MAAFTHNLMELLEQEAAEQSLWETTIPGWHPRNDGEGTGTETEETEETEEETEETEDKDDPVKKAYEKLRESEAREKELNKRLAALERKGMTEAEAAKAEAEEAKQEAADLRSKLDGIERKETVTEVAKSLKFKKADSAVRFLSPEATDEAAIRKELKAVLKDYPELANDGSPPPPVRDSTGREKSSSNASMNQSIRSATGRR